MNNDQSHCADDDLDALALGLMDEAHRTAAERHLAACDVCREAFQARREMYELIQDATPAPPAPAAEAWARMSRRALSRVRDSAAGTQNAVRRRGPMPGGVWRFASMALLFLAGYGVRAIQQTTPRPEWRPVEVSALPVPLAHPIPSASRPSTEYRVALTTFTMRIDDRHM